MFLRVINYLNAGGPKAKSVGFSLTTLRDLHKVKSEANFNLLYFVVRLVKESQPRLLDFMKNYETLPRLVKSDTEVFQAKINEFKEISKLIKDELSLVTKKLKSKDEDEKSVAANYEGYFRPFLDSALGKIDSLEEINREISRKGTRLAELYGLSNSYQSKEFLELINGFVTKVKEANF